MSPRHLLPTIACAALVLGGIALNWHFAGDSGKAARQVDFNRDIRPILNQNCTSCHGGVKQAAQVSFIYRDEVLGKGKSGRPVVVPGRPGASELMARITAHDPKVRMPLNAPPLKPGQIAVLKRWIEEGAQWQDYWAFVPPKPQTPPEVKRSDWVRQPLDRFILARLEEENLTPAPEADKAALLRRVSFDLVGLPPTAEQLATFLADASADAYEKQVDRLLASPQYGERWAAMWLDLARYADSKGYESDSPRPGVWPYRDWVIDAFNRNMPYDRFVITQLAGDLLFKATFQDLIATSFHRQTPNNDESGADDEEYRLVAAMDRVATTWAVLNGVSFNCVQCHSHPYDPIRHTEYYKFLAFFNTAGDLDLPDDRPFLRVPKEHAQFDKAARIQEEMSALRRDVVTLSNRTAANQVQWKPLPIVAASLDQVLGAQRRLADLKRGLLPLRFKELLVDDKKQQRMLLEFAIKQFAADIARIKKAAARDAGKKADTPLKIAAGTLIKAGTVPGQSVFEITALAEISLMTALRLEVWPKDAEKARHTPEEGFIVNGIAAWVIEPDGQEKKIRFSATAPDSATDLDDSLSRLHASSDYQFHDAKSAVERLAENSVFAANSKLFRKRWVVGIPEKPLRLAPGSRIRVELTQTEPIQDTIPAPVPRLRILVSGDERWTALTGAAGFTDKLARLIELDREIKAIPAVRLPVMMEQSGYERRPTLEFERGNFLTKIGPALSPGVPRLLGKLTHHAPADRLAMAQWFFSPGQPLTARVAVNRYWEQLFGTGLVETLEDFGSAGELPSHPQLLDWLALHFQNDLKWDMKALLKEMVLSAAYRQSAKITPVLQERDARNRLLAHGPQQRLSAEMVRDQALVVSGLLTPTLGGPSVMPPQPAAGRSKKDIFSMQWTDATGPDRYRRALYTHLRRNNIYPSLVTFDASAHSISLARRIPTNTPLQALVTLNDPVYQEAAAFLAKRIIKDVGKTATAGFPARDLTEARLIYGAQLVLSRNPKPEELAWLRQFLDKTLASPALGRSRKMDDKELMAFTRVASILLNLDAALTR